MFTAVGSDPTRRFGSHIAVAATQRCPLTCVHCITRSDPTSPRAAAELATAVGVFLTEGGFKPAIISVTGGEPFYDLASTAAVILEAKRLGHIVNVVTSAFWAKTQHAAQEALSCFPTFDILTLSCDPHHARFIPGGYVENAYRAARRAGLRVRIRLVQSSPPTSEERELEQAVGRYASEDEIEHQLLLGYGRAADLQLKGAAHADLEREYCPSTGPYIDADGSVLPCCSAIVAIQSNNPLKMGNVLTDRPDAISSSFLESILFAALKIEGAARLREMLRPKLLQRDVDEMSICDLCYAVCSSRKIYDDVVSQLSQTEAKLEMYAFGAFRLGMTELLPVVEAAALAL